MAPPRVPVLAAALATLCLASSSLAGAAGAPADPSARVRAWITAARFGAADSAATAWLDVVETARPADSLAIAAALDLQVEARALGSLGDLAETQAAAERALRLKEARLPAGDPALATSLANLGEVLRARGRYPEAHERFEQALAIRERSEGSDGLGTAKALNDVAKTLRDLGRKSDALPLYRRALAIRERALPPDDPELAVSLLNLGNVLGDRAMLERALAIRRHAFGEDHILVARALQTLAIVLRLNGDLEAAGPAYEEALEIARRVLPPDHPELSRYLTGVGNLAYATADYERARVTYESSLELTRRTKGPTHPDMQPPLTNLGVVAMEVGDYEQAVDRFRAALDIARTRGPQNRAMAGPLNNLGIALEDLGRHAAADSAYRRSLAIWEAAEGDTSPFVGEVLNSLAEEELAAGRGDSAWVHAARALAILERASPGHPEIPTTLENLGELALRRRDFAGARASFERALALRRAELGPRHPFVARSLVGEATALRALGETRAAAGAALEAEAIRRESLRFTIRWLPERQALRYRERLQSGLDVAVSLAVRGDDDSLVTRTWDALVRSRSLVLDEMASRRRDRLAEEAKDESIGALERAAAESRRRFAGLTVRGPGGDSFEAYRAALDRARTARERDEKALLARSASLRGALARENTGLAEAVATLPPGAALVSYVRYESPEASYAAFVRTPGGKAIALPLGRGEAIDALVSRWRTLAERDAPPPAWRRQERAAGAALRARVWDPVEAALGSVDRVVLVPDGALQLVNFSALRRADGRFLVEAGPTFQYVSTERDLVGDETVSRGNGFLAVGGVDYDAMPDAPPAPLLSASAAIAERRGGPPCVRSLRPAGWPALPEAGREAESIRAAWSRRGPGAGEFRLLEGAAATEGAFKRLAPESRYVHLATHGFYLDGCESGAGAGRRGVGGLASGPAPDRRNDVLGDSPLLRSGLVLAGANRSVARGDTAWTNEDGILTADEIAALDLSGVEGAVLSACETGVGAVTAGEGVFGLRRAFEIAGVRGLVLSLWPVGDRATREWMGAYYAARFDRGASPSEAVRAASRARIAALRAVGLAPDPASWGAFIATGAERR